MTALLLAPHQDDETLWAAFTCIREQPHVIVVLRSELQEQRGEEITDGQRRSETDGALRVLGCSRAEFWPFSDAQPDWRAIERALRDVASLRWPAGDLGEGVASFDRVYAPAVEDGGHPHHNRVGELAD